MTRIFIMPLGLDPKLPNVAYQPKYVPENIPKSSTEFGKENLTIVRADVPDDVAADLAKHADVIALPDDPTTPVDAALLQQLSDTGFLPMDGFNGATAADLITYLTRLAIVMQHRDGMEKSRTIHDALIANLQAIAKSGASFDQFVADQAVVLADLPVTKPRDSK